jgi:hypothetical protein
MKIHFAKRECGVAISIRAAIVALVNRHKAEPAQTVPWKENVPQITPRWNYQPKGLLRSRAPLDAAPTETAETLISSAAARDQAIKHAGSISPFRGTTKVP